MEWVTTWFGDEWMPSFVTATPVLQCHPWLTSPPPLARPSFAAPQLEKGHHTRAKSAAIRKSMSGSFEPSTTTVEGSISQNCYCSLDLSIQRWRWRTATTSSPCTAIKKWNCLIRGSVMLSQGRTIGSGFSKNWILGLFAKEEKKKRSYWRRATIPRLSPRLFARGWMAHSSHRLALLKVAFHRTIVAFSISLFSNGDEGLSPLAPPAPPPKNEAAADRGLYGVIVRKIIGSCFSKD